jgi:hypothetical protein
VHELLYKYNNSLIINAELYYKNKLNENEKIGLLLIAADKYIEYLIPLIESTDKYFLKQQEVTYFIFTYDKDISSIETNRK